MQKAQLAAALVATLGFALHSTAYAADNGQSVTEKKGVKIAKTSTVTEKGSEAACKGKDASCKGKDSSCKGKDAAASTTKGKKHSKKTTTTTTDTTTKDAGTSK